MMKTKSGKEISKIGIGSYGIGGRGHRDIALTEKIEDQAYINALIYTLEKRVNFSEISLGYGHGNTLKLFKKALDQSTIKREDFFLTHSFYPRDLPSKEVIEKDINDFYEIMNTDYADSILVTQSFIVQFGKEYTYELLSKLLKGEKTRYVSLSNASLDCIKEFKQRFGKKFIAHEGHLSFEVRTLQDKGVFDVCRSLDVTNIIWRPLRRNATTKLNWPLLTELAKKYEKTENQIILNWIVSLGFYPMVMSANIKHIDENMSAADFKMKDEDYERITKWRPVNYHPPEIDWDKKGTGDSIVNLVINFEQHIK